MESEGKRDGQRTKSRTEIKTNNAVRQKGQRDRVQDLNEDSPGSLCEEAASCSRSLYHMQDWTADQSQGAPPAGHALHLGCSAVW